MGKASWLVLAAFVAASRPVLARAAGDDVPAPMEAEVTGARGAPARGPKDVTVASSVVTRRELSAPGLRVAELLREQVGTQVSETGGAGAPATASIRGSTAAQVPVYLAGVCLNDDVAGAADLSRIPLWLIDRVEIYRGNAPIDADRLGVGGAIFFEPRWPRSTEAGGGFKLGSFGTRGAWGYASVGDRDAAVLAGVSAEAADNDYPFVDDHGTLLAPTGSSVAHLTNADVTTYDGWLLGRTRAGEHATIDAFGNVTSRTQGVPTLALLPSREARGAFDRVLVGARAAADLDRDGRTRVESRTALSLARTAYHDPLHELDLQATDLTLEGARVDEGLGFDAEPTAALSLHGALDTSAEDLARDADGGAALRAHRVTGRAAIGARQWLGQSLSFQALAAVQCDGAPASPGSAECGDVEPVGRLGVAWTASRWDAFANVGRYVRPPTLGELYGISVIVRGNAGLRSESGLTADAGVRWAGRGGLASPWVSAAAFSRWASDLVSFVRSAQGFAEPVNVDSARVAGVEAQGGLAVGRWLAADVSATWIDPRNTTSGRLTVNDVLPFQSRFVFVPRASAEWRAPPGSASRSVFGRVRGEVLWTYQSSRYADAAGLAVIPEQSSLDAELLVGSADETWTARLRATDLLDVPRVDVVGFPLPGRSFFLSMEAKR